MSRIEEIMENVIERAKRDPEFRARLEQNPRETLRREGHNVSEDELNDFMGRAMDNSTAGGRAGVDASRESILAGINTRGSPKCHPETPESQTQGSPKCGLDAQESS